MATKSVLDLLKQENELLVSRRTYLRLMREIEHNSRDYEWLVYQFIFVHKTWQITRVRLSQANCANKDKSLAMRNLNSAARDMRESYKELRDEIARIKRKRIRLVC